MRASDLVSRLQHLIRQHGDMNVYLDVSVDGLVSIGEIDVDMDDTGIIIWPQDGEG